MAVGTRMGFLSSLPETMVGPEPQRSSGSAPARMPTAGSAGLATRANSPAGHRAGRSAAPHHLAEQMGPPRWAGASPQVCSRPMLI